MKKILYSAAALALAFFAGSCQQENLEPVVSGNTVTYTVQVADAVATRALGDEITAVNELVYEVYRTTAEGVEEFSDADNLLYHKTAEVKNGVATIEIEFVNDQNFTVLFWAHTKDNGVYNVENLTNVTITSPDIANNVNAQAFVGRDFVRDCVSDKNGKVTLVRPVSQLNIATTPESLVFEAETGETGSTVLLKGSSVKVTGLATSYNIATLSAFGATATEYEYTETAVPSVVLPVNGKSYTYVAMNYVGFAPETGTSDVTVSYVINTSEGNIDNEILNVPVKPNYRTNIIGNLITSKTDYTITLEDKWYTPENVYSVWDGSSVSEPAVETDTNTGEEVYVVDEASDLAWLAQMVNGPLTRAATVAEYDFKLTADIDLGNHPWTPIGYNPNEEAGNEKYFTGTFDGNGHTIKNLYIDVKDKGGVGFFGAVHNATIKNVTFENVFVKAVESENDPANTSGAQDKPKYIVGGHMGAVAGYDAEAGEITFKNVHVKGLVKIEGETRAAQGQRIGGIFGGKSSSNVTFENVSVKGTEGSYIKGYCSTAGVSGQIQGVATYKNVHTGVDVHAVTFGAGGIAGIVRYGSTFENCSSEGNITLDASSTQLSSYSANYPYRVGGIAGCWSEGSKTGVLTLTNCSYTGTLTSIDKDGNSPEAFDYAGYVGRGYYLNGYAGSKVIVNGDEYVQAYDKAADSGLYYVNGEYTIASAANLKVFAAKVNDGDTFEGKTIYLANDIDLKNEQWIPIGYWETFDGTFDGNNHTVSNLKHHGTEADCYVGLFGYTNNATIKNLTINNVDIKLVADNSWAGGHMGALVGNADGTIVIENINVTGDVKIDGDLTKAGAGRIGGVVGGNTCTGTIKNVVVNANEGSFVKGNSSVGGIAGQLQPNAIGGELTFENCSSNIDVAAQQFYAGGIIGLAAYSTSFENCSTSGNISVLAGRSGNANDLYRVGGIAGGWDDGAEKILSLTNCSTTCVLSGQSADGKTASGFDCGGFVGRGYSTVDGAKVIVNGTEYIYAGDGVYSLGESLVVANADALVAALAKNKDVIFAGDIKIDPANMSNAYGKTGINVKNGQTIDGNGYTLNIKGAGGTWDSGINTTGGLIKNLTVTGSFRGIFINHTSTHSEKVVLENVTIGGNGTVYTISCDQGLYQGIEATGCTFNGWTSFAKTAGEAKFVNCSFGAGSGYKYCRPYSDTEFIGCTFCPGYAVDETQATVTFTDCTWEE